MEVVNDALREKIRELEDEIHEGTGLLRQAKIKLQESKAEKMELKKNTDFAIKDLRETINGLAEERDALQKKLTIEQNRNKNCASQADEIESLKHLSKQKQEEINLLRNEKTKLLATIENSKMTELNLKKKIDEATADAEKLKNQNTQPDSKHKSVVQDYEKRIEKLTKERDEYVKKFVESGDKFLKAQREMNPHAIADIITESVNAKINKLKKDLDKSKKESSSSKGVLTKEKKKIKELDEQIRSIWHKMNDSELGLDEEIFDLFFEIFI